MNLHEYQAKERFAKSSIPVQLGKIATTSEAAYTIARDFGVPVVVKAQVLVGGRGKAGGIKLANTPDEAREKAQAILGMSIKGHTVHRVLVVPAANIAKEIYLSVTNDRAKGRPLLMASAEGGVEIEVTAHENPAAIIRQHIDPFLGLRDYQARDVAAAMNLPREHWRTFSKIAQNLYACAVANDALLAEINPLVITDKNELLALDGKMIIDDNALFRQEELESMRDTSDDAPEVVHARAAGLSYVKLDGNIGCMVNGAGLAMTTMDMTKLYGGDGYGPANFLDIGGGAQADKVAMALRIILNDPQVKSVLFNIFGGITRGDEVARGILQALSEVPTKLPMIVRLNGTNAAEGRKIIEEANLPNVRYANTLTEAAQLAVAAAKGEL
ncbi:MAG: ADP-forming succinate--CoA ligase subunit beta [Chloroflexota bacterium]|nr:ADP-forming succinate--CoA ligase subunit beta [Chloroflexota bacterium]